MTGIVMSSQPATGARRFEELRWIISSLLCRIGNAGASTGDSTIVAERRPGVQSHQISHCFTVRVKEFRGCGGRGVLQCSQTFPERVRVAGGPDMKRAGKRQACRRAFTAAGTAADLAHDDQGPDAAFRQVIVSRQARHQHELEQLVLMAQHALGQGATWLVMVKAYCSPKRQARVKWSAYAV
jgi:hypothetical protein